MRKRRFGFTLVELLVVIGIIALLVSILLPVLNKARDAGNRAKCLSNVKQIVTGCILYSQSNKPGWYFYRSDGMPGNAIGGDDDLRYFYPKYIANPSVFVCPATANTISTALDTAANGNGIQYVLDLKSKAKTPDQTSGGHSYELRTWLNADYTYPDGTRPPKVKYDYYNKTTQQYLQTGDVHQVKSIKNVKRAAQNVLVTDADDNQGTPVSINNWPDKGNNHGDKGFVMGFADGHAEFVDTGRKILEYYTDSYYYPACSGPGANALYGGETQLYARFGLVLSGGKFTWAP